MAIDGWVAAPTQHVLVPLRALCATHHAPKCASCSLSKVTCGYLITRAALHKLDACKGTVAYVAL